MDSYVNADQDLLDYNVKLLLMNVYQNLVTQPVLKSVLILTANSYACAEKGLQGRHVKPILTTVLQTHVTMEDLAKMKLEVTSVAVNLGGLANAVKKISAIA